MAAAGGSIVFQTSPASGVSSSTANTLTTYFTLNSAGVLTGSNSATISVPDGTRSERFGAGATAAGTDSLSIGNGATASGNTSVAVGRLATSSATNTSALGYSATASGSGSIAIGANSSASAANAIAIGKSASAASNGGTGDNGIAIGSW
ncbi:hypothetical protein HYX70_03810 [Candidatus Saccharibacteria bacterium]|nr:hypothetical protein [Candidatus Saccharibacteria bacterium]